MPFFLKKDVCDALFVYLIDKVTLSNLYKKKNETSKKSKKHESLLHAEV